MGYQPQQFVIYNYIHFWSIFLCQTIKIGVKIAISMVTTLPKSLKLCPNLLYIQVLILINNINSVITPFDMENG